MLGIKRYLEKYTRDRTKVYIIPSKQGMRFVAINFFLFLISITYANNLALLITFIMVTFFILQMFSIHRIVNMVNFDKLNLSSQFINFDHLSRVTTKAELSKELSQYLKISLIDESGEQISGNFLRYLSGTQLQFKLNFKHRGKYHIKRIKFYTLGPTNLFYVWRYYPVDQTVFIYPERKNVDSLRKAIDKGERTSSGEAEFEHHKRYTHGMNSKRIDWKVYAKIDQLYSKVYSDNESIVFDINYNQFNTEKEIRLSYMSYLIDRYFHDSVPFKVTLPNRMLTANTGHRHYEEALEAISEF